jgi:H/ACA ribonucleoprotein complex subunit 3
MKLLMKCPKCGIYTLNQECAADSKKTINPKPAKYSPEDRMGEYRRKAKRAMLEERGLI